MQFQRTVTRELTSVRADSSLPSRLHTRYTAFVLKYLGSLSSELSSDERHGDLHTTERLVLPGTLRSLHSPSALLLSVTTPAPFI